MQKSNLIPSINKINKKVIVLLSILSFVLIISFFTYIYVNSNVRAVNEYIRIIETQSNYIKQQLDDVSHTLNYISPESSANVYEAVMAGSENIYALSYMYNPEYKIGGTVYSVVHKNHSQSNAIFGIYPVQKFYSNLGEKYYQLPWFKEVLATHGSVYTPPQSPRSIDGSKIKDVSVITKFFPIYKTIAGKKIIAVGMVELDITKIVMEVSQKDNLNMYSIIQDVKSDTNGKTLNHIEEISNQPLSTEIIKNIKHEYINGKAGVWRYHDLTLYYRIILAKGSVDIIITVPLLKILILYLLILFFGIVFIWYGTVKLIKRLNNKHEILLSPLHEIIQETKDISNGLLRVDFDKEYDVVEFDNLRQSINQMKIKLTELVKSQNQISAHNAEMELAASIQKSFTGSDSNKIIKNLPDVNIHRFFQSGSIISGDILDVICVSNNRYIYILTCDTVGKDVAASIFSMFVLAKYRTLHDRSPAKILQKLNQYICQLNTENMFITAQCAIFDTIDSKVLISSAGHPNPYILSKDRVWAKIDISGSLFLGVEEEEDYVDYQFPLADIQGIFMYTDGVTETLNELNEEYGFERLPQFLNSMNEEVILYPLDSLYDDIQHFSIEGSSLDDISMVLIRT